MALPSRESLPYNLEEVDTDPQLTWMIEEFLYGRGDVKVAPLFADDLPMYGLLASLMDALGFDNFVEGRILTVLVDFQFSFYQGTVTQWTSERWASKGSDPTIIGYHPSSVAISQRSGSFQRS